MEDSSNRDRSSPRVQLCKDFEMNVSLRSADRDGTTTKQCTKTNAQVFVNSLTIHMLQCLAGEDDYVVGTASLCSVLAIAQTSIADEKRATEDEKFSQEDVATAMQYIFRLLEGKNDLTGNEVNLLQNIWINKEISREARRLLGTYYSCEARLLPMTKNTISERKLKKKLHKLDVTRKFHRQFEAANFKKHSTQAMLLTSAVHIAMSWRETFQSNLTRECQFYVSPEVNEQVSMMTLRSGLVCARCDVIRATVVEVPLTADNMSMLVYVPYEKNGLEFLENNLTLENFSEVLEKLKSSKQRPVDLSLPRFCLSYNDVISTTSSFEELYSKTVTPSEIFHTISVDINEQGINMPLLDKPKQDDTIIGRAVLDGIRWTTITADHPFLFMLLEMNAKMIFISGKVSKPQWNQRENISSNQHSCKQRRNYWCCI